MELLKDRRFDSTILQNSQIEKTKYEDCVFYNSNLTEITWFKCHFHNTYFLHDTLIKNCKFIDCNFTGSHTNMGGPATYDGCEFENVLFKNIQFWGATFVNCIISGIAHNIVFYGKDAPEGWETIFKNVDISKLQLEFVDFRCNFDLSTTVK